MPKTCNFLGRVTMYSDHAEFPGPKVVDLSFDTVFDVDRWSITPEAFGQVPMGKVEFAGIPLGDLCITLAETAQGTADAASGAFTVAGKLAFSVIGHESILRAAFDCVTPQDWLGTALCGSLYDSATGEVKLAALNQFEGSLLDGVWCAVLLEGKFEPRPW